MGAQDPDEISTAMHRRLAVSCFNRSWDLMLTPDRTPAQDDELLHTVHASAYHWRRYGGTPANLARGENQCARVYAALGRGEPAKHHAQRCLDLVEAGGEGLEDWDLASALEVLARANLASGDTNAAIDYAVRANSALDAIADLDDRKVIAEQLRELKLLEDPWPLRVTGLSWYTGSMAQTVAKDELHKMIDSLPEDPTWDEVRYLLHVRAEIEEGRRSAREEPTVTTEELLAEYGLTLDE